MYKLWKVLLVLLLVLVQSCASKPTVPGKDKDSGVINVSDLMTQTTESSTPPGGSVEDDENDEVDNNKFSITASETTLKKTDMQFKNGEWIYEIIRDGKTYGEWWPVNALDLISKESHPDLFEGELDAMINQFNAVAVAPDGMTSGASPGKLEGKAIIDGVIYEGDGSHPQYGIILIENQGHTITFTHQDEVLRDYNSMDEYFSEHEGHEGTTLFYTPSIKRGDKELKNDTLIHRALVNRVKDDGEQLIGMVVLTNPIKNKEMIELMNGLNRNKDNGEMLSETTHIFYTDGGDSYGQAARLDEDKNVTLLGARNSNLVTNYLVIY